MSEVLQDTTANSSQNETESAVSEISFKKANLSIESENSAKSKENSVLDTYGETEECREANIRAQLIASFKESFHGDITEDQIHNYYFCKHYKCKDICSADKKEMTKDSKFQHKCIFDPELAKCKATGIWSLTYIDGKGMFCSLCRLINTAQPSNASKIWNSQPNKRYKPETIRGHFLVETGKRTMHTDAAATEKAKCGSYFIE